MAFEYDGKIYRNLEEQVDYNKDCINDLDLRVTTLENKEPPVYTPMDLDLNTGIVASTYDTINGLSLTTQGTIKSNMGTDQVAVDYSIPIIGSDTISIDLDQTNNKLVFKVHPTANLKGNSFTAENVSGSVTQSTKLSYDGYITITNPAGTRMFNIPWNYGGGSLLTDKSVKTLFGKSIFGSGKIDLYRHNICFTSTDQDKMAKIRFIVISSKNVNVNSLANLKTLLGNTFTYPVNGGTGDNKSVYEITETGYKAGATPYVLYDTVTAYPAGTWTDTVTTV